MNMVENYARDWWRFASNRTALLWAAFTAWIVADPANMAAFVGSFPADMQPLIGPAIGIAIMATQIAARGAVQPKLTK